MNDMTTMTPEEAEEIRKREQRKLVAGVGVALIIAVSILALVTTTILTGCGWLNCKRFTAEELTREYVESEVDEIGESVARFVLAGAPVFIQELGGEYVEDRIHDVVQWEYDSDGDSDGEHSKVIATSRMAFDVNVAAVNGSINAMAPFNAVVDVEEQMVVSFQLDLMAAKATYDFPGMAKVEEVVDKVVEAKAIFDEGDCIGAARAAGVGEDILAVLEKPVEERNFLEEHALALALNTTGLAARCGDLGDETP